MELSILESGPESEPVGAGAGRGGRGGARAAAMSVGAWAGVGGAVSLPPGGAGGEEQRSEFGMRRARSGPKRLDDTSFAQILGGAQAPLDPEGVIRCRGGVGIHAERAHKWAVVGDLEAEIDSEVGDL